MGGANLYGIDVEPSKTAEGDVCEYYKYNIFVQRADPVVGIGADMQEKHLVEVQMNVTKTNNNNYGLLVIH